MYPFTFKVTYYTFYPDHSEQEHACGVLFADSYADAARKIEKAYSDDLLSIDRLYAFEAGELLEIPNCGEITADGVIEHIESYN